MAGLHKPTISYIDKTYLTDNNSGQPDYEKICRTGCLCLQLSDSRIDYCIYDSQLKRYTVFESYDLNQNQKMFHPNINVRNLTDEINSFFKSIEWFSYHYQAVSCVFDNKKSTLVPDTLYDITKMDMYLRFNHFLDHTEEVAVNELKELEVMNIYALPQGFPELLLKYFPYARITHITSIFIKSMFNNLNEHHSKNTVFVNFRSSCFDMLLFDRKKLKYFNTFLFNTDEDFIFYFHFVLDQLKVAPIGLEVIITGEIENESRKIALLNRYSKSVSFTEDAVLYDKEIFSNKPSHFYYTLLNAIQCV